MSRVGALMIWSARSNSSFVIGASHLARGLRETERVPIRSSAGLIPVASKGRRQSNHDRQERPLRLRVSDQQVRTNEDWGMGALTKIGTWRLVKTKWSVGSFRIRTRTAVARTRHSLVITVVDVIATLEKKSRSGIGYVMLRVPF